MTRTLLIVAVLASVAALCTPTLVGADPGGPNLQPRIDLTCTGDVHVTVNPGTFSNQGRVAWATDSNSVFVTAFLSATDETGTVVLFDSKKGLTNLITCTGEIDGFTLTAIGFFTPR